MVLIVSAPLVIIDLATENETMVLPVFAGG
jgi:hypothetical protein